MVHQSRSKEKNNFGLTIFLEILFAERQKKVKRRTVQRVLSQGFFICLYITEIIRKAKLRYKQFVPFLTLRYGRGVNKSAFYVF